MYYYTEQGVITKTTKVTASELWQPVQQPVWVFQMIESKLWVDGTLVHLRNM